VVVHDLNVKRITLVPDNAASMITGVTLPVGGGWTAR
jgi:hypothetical protein